MLKELFERVLKEYKSARTENFTGHPIANILRNEIPGQIKQDIYNTNKYKISGSAGQGNWTYSPWVAILDKEITESPQKGYYLVYLFREDMKGVYLSLNQGMTEIKDQYGSNKTKKVLKARAEEYREELGEYSELLDSIDLKPINSSSNSVFYEDGNVYAKYYDLSDLPSDKIILNDLNLFLDLYDSLVNNNKKSPKEKVGIWRIYPGDSKEREYLWPFFEENGFIGIGWFGNNDFIQKDYREFQSEDEIKNLLIKYENKSEKTSTPKMIWDFTNSIKIGDYIVASGGKNKVLGIGIIKSDYIGPNDPDNPNVDNGYNHLRKVEWIITDEFEINNNTLFNRQTLNSLDGFKWNEILIQYYKNTNFNLIQGLFDEFNRNYLSKEIGKTHYNSYQKESELLKNYFDKINEDPSIMENIDDPILNYIVPIKRPSVSTVGFKSFRAFKYTDEQMPGLTKAIVDLISNLDNTPDEEEQKNIIKSFKSGEYSKGSQTGVISPLLHGLNHKFLIINNKTVSTVNFLSKIIDMDIKINGDLLSYINNNEKLKKFLSILSEEVSELSDFHVFDAFCHWLCDSSLAGYATGNPLPIFEVDPPEYDSSFIEFLSKEGYYFEPEMIENFLLSLKVKPFVILSGNSGTGKTKIAQLFAQYISSSKSEISSITTEVKVGKSAKNRGWTLKKSVLDELDVPNYNGTYDIKIDGIKSKGNFYMLSQLFYEDKNNKIKSRLTEIANKNPEQKVSLEILLPSNVSSQYKIVPVGANWTENRHIIGFYNVITDEYMTSDALEIIREALKPENKDKPYFLILDEMNLSHVERYFADFLSAMESGEHITLHKSDEEEKYPKKVKIPKNLFVIGTVNVDETTYMFSPKVLDRANVIEFSTIPVKNYMSNGFNPEELNGNVEYIESPLSDLDVRKYRIEDIRKHLINVKTNEGILWDVLSDELNKFQEVLKKAGFDFGFRVIDEILRFIYVAWIYEGSKTGWNGWKRYFDAQIKQKMIPKIHGSQRTLESVIKELFELCLDGESEKAPRSFGDILLKNVKYPRSALKIQEMDKVLYEQRYVSFIN